MCAAPRFRSSAGLLGRVSVTLALTLSVACSPDKKVGTPEAAAAKPPTAAIVADDGAAEEIPSAAGSAEDDAAPAENGGAEAVAAAGAEADPAPEEAAAGTEIAAADEASDDEPADAAGKRTVLVLGDSLAATGFGALLERRLDGHPDVNCFRKAKSSSGLARPDFFDWMGEAKRQVAARSPDVVVVIIGGNDGQDLTPKTGKGKRVRWKTDDWNEAYRERVASFLDEIRGDGRKVLWLGLPKTGTVSFEKKLDLIREVHQNAIADLEDVEYLDTIQFFVDDDGNLRKTADVGRKKDAALRADDGIHFTMAGSQYFADQVYPEVLRVLGIDDAGE
ncbi:MAG: DUF459 domain-containing protein [Myxococcales bacterium]|nr:DUF459 domain-containing protein [Myxococcales bacterium]